MTSMGWLSRPGKTNDMNSNRGSSSCIGRREFLARAAGLAGSAALARQAAYAEDAKPDYVTVKTAMAVFAACARTTASLSKACLTPGRFPAQTGLRPRRRFSPGPACEMHCAWRRQVASRQGLLRDRRARA